MGKVYSLKQMSVAMARDDGKAVKFAFKVHRSDKLLECECPTEAIPIIVAKLSAALEQAAKYADPSPNRETTALQIDKFEVGTSVQKRAVVLSLYPAPNCAIPLALSPGLSKQVAEGLQKGIATLQSKLN